MVSTCVASWNRNPDVRITPTELPDVLVIEPDVYRDSRGFFLESYHTERYRSLGIDSTFVQDNQSRSVAGTLRGLRLQWGGRKRNS
jgi:dTDP-4-dehydrorhamnose 3,5-epimerase